MTDVERRGRGRGTKNDPARRERILLAAARIIVRSGIDAVTFRAVAAEADVPLGSTTYYFVDKDALLLDTVRRNRDASGERFDAMVRSEVRDHGPAGGLARTVQRCTVDDRDTFLFDYSLYLAAFHHSVLRAEAVRWQMLDVFRELFPSPLAEGLTYLVDGMLLRAMMMNERIGADEAAPLIEGVVRGLEEDAARA